MCAHSHRAKQTAVGPLGQRGVLRKPSPPSSSACVLPPPSTGHPLPALTPRRAPRPRRARPSPWPCLRRSWPAPQTAASSAPRPPRGRRGWALRRGCAPPGLTPRARARPGVWVLVLWMGVVSSGSLAVRSQGAFAVAHVGQILVQRAMASRRRLALRLAQPNPSGAPRAPPHTSRYCLKLLTKRRARWVSVPLGGKRRVGGGVGRR